jgi:hypothetical protein
MKFGRLVCDDVHLVRLMGNLLLPSSNLQMVVQLLQIFGVLLSDHTAALLRDT